MSKTTIPVAGTISILAPIIGTLARVWRTFIPFAVIALASLIARDASAQAEAWTTYQYYDSSKYVEGLCSYERSLGTSDAAGNLAVTGSASAYYKELIVAKFGASSGAPEWSRVYAGAGGGNSCGTAVAFDGAGNIFATGYFGKPYDGRDAVVLKLNGANGDIIWSQLIEDGGRINSIAIDSLGNPVVTGQLGTMKLSGANGAILWVNRNSPAVGQQVLVDPAGDAYIRAYGYVTKLGGANGTQRWIVAPYPTNTYDGSIVLDGQGHIVYARAPAYGDDPARATKINTSTGAIAWETSLGNIRYMGSAAVDSAGNTYVAGVEWNATGDILRAVRISGATGSVDWTVSLGGGAMGSYVGDSTTVDAAGNVVVLGRKLVTQYPNGFRDYGLLALRLSASNGATLWSSLVGGTGPDDFELASPPFATADGAIRIAGAFYDSYGHRPQIRALKLDGQSGSVVSNQAVNHFVNGTEAFDIAADANGNVYSLGREMGRDSTYVVRVSKLLASGAEAWTTRIPVEQYQERLRIVVASNGNLLVARGDRNAMTPNQHVVSLSADSGAVLWDRTVAAPPLGGIADIRSVAGGDFYVLLIGNGEYAVTKHSRADGQEIWRRSFSTLPGNFPDPAFAISADGTVHVAGFEQRQPETESVVRASRLDPGTGAAIWSVTLPGQASYGAYAASGENGDMYISARDRGGNGLGLPVLLKLAASSGAEVWRQPIRDFGPILVDTVQDVIQISISGNFASKHRGTDGSPLWSVPLSETNASIVGSTKLDAGGNFFIGTVGYGAMPAMSVMKASGSNGQIVWQHIGPTSNAGIYRGALELGPSGSVYMTGTGKEDWLPLAGYIRKLADSGMVDSQAAKILAIRLAGTGTGRVESAPAGVSCGYQCVKSFPVGAMVTLTPVPSGTSQFLGWSGGGCSGTGNCTVTMDASKTVTASFGPRAFTLEVVKTGNGTGRVISAPSGIDCGVACVAPFVASASIVLTPTPDAGSLLVATRVSCAGLPDTTIQACVNAGAANVTATYEFVSGDITIGIFLSQFPYLGNGRIVSTPPGIDCPNGGTCTYKFPAGTNVTLSASTTADQDFLSWGLPSGVQCANPTATTCTLNASATLSPQFRYKPTTVTVVKTGGGGGTVKTNSAGIDCGATCVGTIASIGGGLDGLNAIPDAGSVFVGFSGCKSVFPATTCYATPYTTSTVEARFERLVDAAPTIPRNVRAFAGDGQATVYFDPPTNPGMTQVQNYFATCQPGDRGGYGSTSPIRVEYLANGTEYSCTLAVSNQYGASPAVSFTVTPSAAAPFELVRVLSRKSHPPTNSGILPRDVLLDVTKPITGSVTVESRSNAQGHLLVFQFTDRIDSSGSVTLTDKNGMPIGQSSVSISGNEMHVSLGNIPDRSRVKVQLNAVNNSASVSANLGFLVGDVDGNGVVDMADEAAIRSRSGQRVTDANARFDINLSGVVSAADLAVIKRRRGNALP